ncbi:MAG TPA: cytochrome c biogenesis protein CcdA [Candidatus Binatia bacterium]|nr:cytochrome c biogenesis protein CcdA [Candidatus Binatia bacterium]
MLSGSHTNRKTARACFLAAWLFCLLAGAVTADGGKVALTLEPSAPAARKGSLFPLDVIALVESGWHINAHQPSDSFLIPTEVTLTLPAGVTAEPIQYPRPDRKRFAFAGKELLVYEGKLGIATGLHIPADFAAASIRVAAVLRYQACNDSLCLRPTTAEAELVIPISTEAALAPSNDAPTSQSAAGRPAINEWLDERGFLFTLFAVGMLGIGLNLTPCVYPLISVTVAYFGGHANGRTARKAALASIYVLGIALSFAGLGVIAALSGGLFGAALQKPAVMLFIASVMITLALSSFGVYQLRPPAAVMQWAGGATGGVAGAAFMGLTMGVVAAPCIGPMVLALLVAVGTRQDPVLGFALFLALGVGMGLPYLVLALAAGSLGRLPRSGEWLVWSERLFGFVLIGMAAHFAGPLLPPGVRPWVIPGVVAIAGVYLGFIDPSGRAVRSFQSIKRAVGLAALALAAWIAWPPQAESAIQWQDFTSTAIEQSRTAGRPVVLEFGAEWCIPCGEMARTTFVDRQVVRAAARFDMIKADITEESDAARVLLEKFDVRGVPTILVFDTTGKEVGRLVGFTTAAELLDVMGKATSGI